MTGARVGPGAARTSDRDAAAAEAISPDRDTFAGVLFLSPAGAVPPEVGAHEPPRPDHFHDLNLDQIEDGMTVGRERYELSPYFRVPAPDLDTARLRQDVFRDLEQGPVRSVVAKFGDQMTEVRQLNAKAAKLRDAQPQRQWILRAIDRYCRAIADLADGLDGCELSAAALISLHGWLDRHRASADYASLRDTSTDLLRQLNAVRYDLLIRGGKLTVAPFDGEADYSAEVLATFERFRQGDVADHHAKISASPFMDHVQVAVLDMIAKLFPQLFGEIAKFCGHHQRFVDSTIARVDRELQFYLGYLDYIAPMKKADLPFCYPTLSRTAKDIDVETTFDLALAAKLTREREPVVTNDVQLDGRERILVVSGPNQGGKTTLARTVGQLCHLAALGCPVPGSRARLFVPDAIYTHFEREEEIETLAGKLEDELKRIHAILDVATGDSLIILNEIFNSTTVQDAELLSRRILTTISDLDAVCVAVTFIDELSTLNDKTVSMVSLVDPDDPAVRTYRLERRRADGRAYALALAAKYRLTYDMLRERIR
jgi:hypothetical protein